MIRHLVRLVALFPAFAAPAYAQKVDTMQDRSELTEDDKAFLGVVGTDLRY